MELSKQTFFNTEQTKVMAEAFDYVCGALNLNAQPEILKRNIALRIRERMGAEPRNSRELAKEVLRDFGVAR
jgi:hypothetical protein